MKTVWDEVVDTDYSGNGVKTDDHWLEAVDKIVCKFHNCEQPRDVMLTHMAPRGGLIKDPF